MFNFTQEDAIVDIKPAQYGYFGGPGKMLLPCPATVAALIREVPEHKLITTDLLRKVLAERRQVRGTCPVTTRKALQAIAAGAAAGAEPGVAYWRVVKQDGTLIDQYPGGVEGHAALLRKEGFAIEGSGKKARVVKYKDALVIY